METFNNSRQNSLLEVSNKLLELTIMKSFSSVARFDSIGLSYLSQRRTKCTYNDLTSRRFLEFMVHGELDEVIYMQQPKEYEDRIDHVCKLNRNLYDLKKASRCWNYRFTPILKKHSLTITSADYCVFTNRNDRDDWF